MKEISLESVYADRDGFRNDYSRNHDNDDPKNDDKPNRKSTT